MIRDFCGAVFNINLLHYLHYFLLARHSLVLFLQVSALSYSLLIFFAKLDLFILNAIATVAIYKI